MSVFAKESSEAIERCYLPNERTELPQSAIRLAALSTARLIAFERHTFKGLDLALGPPLREPLQKLEDHAPFDIGLAIKVDNRLDTEMSEPGAVSIGEPHFRRATHLMQGWLTTTEHPAQYLAACQELNDVIATLVR